MNNRKWREAARRSITRALADVTTMDETELRAILFDAYPFGARELTPYRVWCEEVRAEVERRIGGWSANRKPSKADTAKWNAWHGVRP